LAQKGQACYFLFRDMLRQLQEKFGNNGVSHQFWGAGVSQSKKGTGLRQIRVSFTSRRGNPELLSRLSCRIDFAWLYCILEWGGLVTVLLVSLCQPVSTVHSYRWIRDRKIRHGRLQEDRNLKLVFRNHLRSSAQLFNTTYEC
jgi:hypothetical protein